MTSLTPASKVTYDVDLMVRDMAIKGLMRTDLARKAKVSPMSVTKFLRRQHQTARMAVRLAKAIGYSVRRYIESEAA